MLRAAPARAPLARHRGLARAPEVARSRRIFGEQNVENLENGNFCKLRCVEKISKARSGARRRDRSYLRFTAGHRLVPVELGAHYLDASWSERLASARPQVYIDSGFYT